MYCLHFTCLQIGIVGSVCYGLQFDYFQMKRDCFQNKEVVDTFFCLVSSHFLPNHTSYSNDNSLVKYDAAIYLRLHC